MVFKTSDRKNKSIKKQMPLTYAEGKLDPNPKL